MQKTANNKSAILELFQENPGSSFHFREIARLLNKKPGVFQRAINALVKEGVLESTYRANTRLFKLNKTHAFLFQKAIESLKLGDHASLIYENDDQWRETVVPFMGIGLNRGEKCVYIADNNSKDKMRDLMKQQEIDVESRERSGQLVIIGKDQAYTLKDPFRPCDMIALITAETKKALSQGYSGLRVTGEMTWSLKGHPGSERLTEYEANLNRDFFNKFPCVAICQYDKRVFDAKTIRDIILSHPLVIFNNGVYRNHFYISPVCQPEDDYAENQINHWLGSLS
jgi:hypothetical protein